ncbi:MAG: hypothetical protein ACSHX7_12620 [Luteolibacter sp.]
MSNRLLRVIVLLLSITAAGTYVWFCSQPDKPFAPDFPPEETVTEIENSSSATEEEVKTAMLPSSKSIQMIDLERTKEFMMSSSKIGIVMSDEDVRKLLEEKAEEKPLAPTEQQEE